MDQEQWDRLSWGEKAWKLGLIIKYMNDEEAYYSGWLYIWPDGETYEECLSDFEHEESYKELEQSFKFHYKECQKYGLYSHRGVPSEVVDAAHFWDTKLGLPPIEVIK